MPRRARIALPNVPVHVIQRGNNRQPCFFSDEDYRRYLGWLTEYASKTGCRKNRGLSPVLPVLRKNRGLSPVLRFYVLSAVIMRST